MNRRGKTVTVNLAPAQANAFRHAIKNQRRVDNLLPRMRAASPEYRQATTKSVIRRPKAPFGLILVPSYCVPRTPDWDIPLWPRFRLHRPAHR